jgi:hypothetical protein
MNKKIVLALVIIGAMIVLPSLATASSPPTYSVSIYPSSNSNSDTIYITYSNVSYEYLPAHVQIVSNGQVSYVGNFTGETEFSIFASQVITVDISVGNTIVFYHVYTEPLMTSTTISAYWPISIAAIVGIIGTWIGRGMYDSRRQKKIEGEIYSGNDITEEAKRFALDVKQGERDKMKRYEELDKLYREHYGLDKETLRQILDEAKSQEGDSDVK